MKQTLLISALAGVLGFGIPAILESCLPLSPALVQSQSPPVSQASVQPDALPPETTEPAATDAALLPPTDGCILIDLLLEDGSVTQLPLDEYLTGVLLAEMPASFPVEAQMAQAVVARTYALRQWSGNGKHENADLCSDPACCQAWISYETYAEKNGTAAARQAADQAALAVIGTDAQALFYGGSLIDATYFSCSGGRTEAAVAVWGSDVPYLQSVESPGEEEAAHYSETAQFSSDQFRDLLAGEVNLSGDLRGWFGQVSYTEGGGVASMTIGGKEIPGTRLRRLLGLRSTMFTVSVTDSGILIHTLGNGHRVGMSQYGAKAMAENGSGYQEILEHYYTGAELLRYTYSPE